MNPHRTAASEPYGNPPTETKKPWPHWGTLGLAVASACAGAGVALIHHEDMRTVIGATLAALGITYVIRRIMIAATL